MTNIEPYIVVNDVEKIKKETYGNAGKIALIGAFPTNTVNVEVYTDSYTARNSLKGTYKLPEDNLPAHASMTVVPTTYTSFYCLDYIFNQVSGNNGPESVVVVNTNYGLETLVQSVDNTSLASACTLLKEEDFDIVTIADNVKLATAGTGSTYVLNPMWSTLKTFTDTMYSNQKPCGVITGVDIDSNATVAVMQSFKTLWADKGMYKAVSTPILENGASTSLNIAQSGCWHSAFTSGRAVNKSETSKLYPGIIGEDTKTRNPLTGTITWQGLLDNGFHTTKYRSRKDSTIQCLSNITPADYDMKIERVKNYMIRRLTLSNYLGEDNNGLTRDVIRSLFAYEKELAVNNGYLLDMEYSISSVTSEKVVANVKFVISDIIRIIELNVTLDVTTDVEEEATE